MISVLRHELIAKRGWIGEDDFSHELAMATTLPGAMVVNFSLFSGYRLRGVPGAAAAFLGAVLPSFISIVLIAIFLFPFFTRPLAAAFLRGASATVAGLLAHTAFTMCKPMITRASHITAAIIAALIAMIPNVNPIFALILVSAAVYRMSANQNPARGRNDKP
jgi:chromate transporter